MLEIHPNERSPYGSRLSSLKGELQRHLQERIRTFELDHGVLVTSISVEPEMELESPVPRIPGNGRVFVEVRII